ncbi:MAG: DUF2927 domain-containing protein [Clostridia bacterium]|nr:DUF2927 domain-containing protein [Clostridia bacterium]
MRKTYICIAISVVLVVICVLMGVRSIKEYSQGIDDAAAATTAAPASTAAPATGLPASQATASQTGADPAETTGAPTPALFLPEEVDRNELSGYFLDVAFGSEYVGDGDDADHDVIRKFTVPVRCYFSDGCPEELFGAVESTFAFMNSVPGFPGIQLTNDPSEANLTVYFGSKEHVRDAIGITDEDFNGLNRFMWDNSVRMGEIFSGEVGIVTEELSLEKQISVIYEELLQVMGLPHDSDLRADSLFSIYPEICPDIPEIDSAVFRLLYCPQIEPGMSREEAQTVLSELLFG